MADQQMYDSALKAICNKKGVGYIPLVGTDLENHLSYDGVHPLSSGHAIIARRVLNAIIKG